VLLSNPENPESTVAVISTGDEAPSKTSPRLHVTVPLDSEQTGTELTKVTLGGRMSTSSTFSAVSGPLFVTVMV